MIRVGGGVLKIRTSTYDIEKIQNVRVFNLMSFSVLNPIPPEPPPLLPIEDLLFSISPCYFILGGIYEPIDISYIEFQRSPAFGTLIIDYPYPSPEPELPISQIEFHNSPVYCNLTESLPSIDTSLYAHDNPLKIKTLGTILKVRHNSEWKNCVIRIWTGIEWKHVNYRVWDGNNWIMVLDQYFV